ncbi:MAG: NYN domain-containing protein [Rhodanobacter sp.]|nr:NYN domain-containing protein [Rhodanobacter sp.]
MVTAVLVDAEFFLKRSRYIFGPQPPDVAASKLHRLALEHLNDDKGRRVARLYRIFVYDAPPAAWKGHKPLSKEPMDIFFSPTAQWRREFHETLRGLRKVALRMGEVPTNQVRWQIRVPVLKDLMDGAKRWTELTDDDFRLDLRQKGVDMRLGLDIAALAFKQQVNQIVLISGDVDFVPAAKLARREGIDFILDPMWATIRSDLYEHVDGLRTVCPKPVARPEVTGKSE